MACTATKQTINVPWDYDPSAIHIDTSKVNRWAFDFIETSENGTNVTCEKAILTIQIVGHKAQYRLRFVVKNNLNRELEAMFNLPMPAGVRVNHLAMDIKNQMRNAVIVEKEKGRVVFDDVSRQKMDPALLEQTSENIYRLRVFPLAARGRRTIEIGFDKELDIQCANAYSRLKFNVFLLL